MESGLWWACVVCGWKAGETKTGFLFGALKSKIRFPTIGLFSLFVSLCTRTQRRPPLSESPVCSGESGASKTRPLFVGWAKNEQDVTTQAP